MDMDGLFQGGDKDFVVIDFFGIGCFGDCFDNLIQVGFCDGYFDFYFGQEIDYVFCVVIQFGVIFLMFEVFYFGNGDVLNVDFGQCFMYIV